VREKVEDGSPLRDRDGMGWRIDIYDALSYDTLAEARRRPYLYTREAWPEDEGRELKAQQGLYRIQQALESFRRVTGQYPLRLLGADNRRDELLAGKYLIDRYPACGFDDRPMEMVQFGVRSSGDFSYYSYDRDGDGKLDAYWLLLHGKVPAHALFADRDPIMVLAEGYQADQPALARQIADWWEGQQGEVVGPGPALSGTWPEAADDPAPADQSSDPALAPEAAAQDTPPAVLDSMAAAEAILDPVAPEAVVPAVLPAPAAVDPPPTLALPVPTEVLIVRSWGF
jgi:hypothetical protein